MVGAIKYVVISTQCFDKIDLLAQERCNSNALAMELHITCFNSPKYVYDVRFIMNSNKK